MTWKSDAKFEVKLTCCFENDMRNLANFHPRALESAKIETQMGCFCPNQKIYDFKTYRGVVS